MNNKDIDIIFVTDINLFDKKYINKLKEMGNIIFCSKEDFISKIILNNNKKIVIYDQNYKNINFPQEILTKSKNILAIFLGITDSCYINLDICKEKDIQVFTLPEDVDNNIAEYLIMLLFTSVKKIKNKLTCRKVGIIGLTSVGKKVADACDSIGMKVYYWDKKIRQTNYDYISLNKILKTCDVIYFCLEEKYENKPIITKELFQLLKDNAIFISFTDNKIREKHIKGNIIEVDKKDLFSKENNTMRIKKWYESIVEYLNDLSEKPMDEFESNDIRNKIEDAIIVNIRKAKFKDIPAIVELYKKENWLGNNNSIEKIIKNYNYKSKRDYLLVAEYKGKVVGSISFGVNKAYTFNCMEYIVFDYLVVEKKHRRKTVGKQLINYVNNFAKKRNIESIWVVSSIGRNKSHTIYEKMGFDDPVKGFRKVFIQEQ